MLLESGTSDLLSLSTEDMSVSESKAIGLAFWYSAELHDGQIGDFSLVLGGMASAISAFIVARFMSKADGCGCVERSAVEGK